MNGQFYSILVYYAIVTQSKPEIDLQLSVWSRFSERAWRVESELNREGSP